MVGVASGMVMVMVSELVIAAASAAANSEDFGCLAALAFAAKATLCDLALM
jgi:hypothetical protein